MSDGFIVLALGKTGSGKSSLLLDLVEDGPFVWVGPEPMNPEVKLLPWCFDTREDLNENAGTIRNPAETIMIRVKEHNPEIFEILNIHNRTIVFDECSCVSKPPETKEPFLLFLRMARSRGQKIYISTHRIIKDIAPEVSQNLAIYIYQVGRQKHPDAIDELYNCYDTDNELEFDEYKEKIRNLEKYDYQRRNFNSSVLVIMGDENAPRPERELSDRSVE